MAVSGFFIEVFKELASALVEKIDGFIRNENEKKQIEQKLNEHFDRYFKEQYEYLPMSNEFDIQSLHEWLLENLYKRVAICFLADTSAATIAKSLGMQVEMMGAQAEFDRQYGDKDLTTHNMSMFEYFRYEIKRGIQYLWFVFF